MFGNDQQDTDDTQTASNDMSTMALPSNQDDVKTDAPAAGTGSSLPGSLGDPTPPTDTTLPDPLAGSDTTAPEAPAALDDPADDSPPADGSGKTPSFTSVSSDPDDLLEIKKNALSQLGPLVGHLDQSPEEKFRTMMMMIQASDDQSLVQSAYEAAQAITDDKVRAQALLDVINEINYFTQQQKTD